MSSSEAIGEAPTALEVRAALERILSSRSFENAGRASEFLRFAVAETLAGRTDRLKGYTIARHVFGKPADFDAQTDPLVRVEALRLRQRLLEYYAGDGSADAVRIELPRGGYVVSACYTKPAAEERAATRAYPIGSWARRAAVGAAVAILAIASIVLLRPQPLAEPRGPTELSHKTQIVVAPIENLSTNDGLQRLAASLTEEIMLRLDGLDLFVVATQAQWYGAPSGLDDVLGKEHTYVLTGSVREHGKGLRISVRIIEAATGTQLWSAAYDEPHSVEQQPEFQANVARDVAAAAAPFGPVFDAELELARRATTLELPDCQTRYRAFRRATDPELFPDAAACFHSLVERRPDLAHAWAGVAMIAIDEHLFYSGSGDVASPLARGWAAVNKALELDASNVLAQVALARAQYYSGDPEFIATAEKAIALDPKNVEVLALMGILFTAYGDDLHGLELVARSQSLSPRPLPTFNVAYAFANLRAGKWCEALQSAESMAAPKWFITYVIATSAAAHCGDDAAMAAHRKRLLALAPSFEAEARALIGYWRFDPVLEETLLSGLRRAGLDLHDER